MSSTTWTPTAVASSSAAVRGAAWRAVEAQHRVSTIRLVDTLEEQAQLERLLDQSKPVAPEGLHWLLATPFRYPPLPQGSRFRGPTDPGVLYAADVRRTACAELGFWRWRFLLDSPDLAAIESSPQTLFTVHFAGRAVDLREGSLARDAGKWRHPADYGPCQALAGVARSAGIEVIRYASARDPEAGGCVAVLTPRALVPAPLDEQGWRLTVTRARVFWHRDSVLLAESFEFDAGPWRAVEPSQ